MKKFNVLDIIIVLFLCVVLAGLLFINKGGEVEIEEAKVNVVLEITEKPEGFYKNVVIGDTVTDKVTKAQIGVVTGVTSDKCTLWGYNAVTGEGVESTLPGYENVYVEMELLKSSGAAVGDKLSIITKHFAGWGYVVELEETN